MFILGFDVAKDKLDGSLINRSGQLKQAFLVANTPLAIADVLAAVCRQHPKLQVGCESTGHYHVNLVRVCLEKRIPLCILNPLTTKQYTRATIRGRKTDRDDALSIAQLVLRGEGRAATYGDLALPKVYVRLATKLVQQKQALDLQQHFLAAMGGSDTEQLFLPAITALNDLVVCLRQQAQDQIQAADYRLLLSIAGIGPVTATSILAEVGDITRFPSARQLIAYAGLDPRVKQSGITLNRNTKLTKRGSPELRRALFLVANAARRSDPELKLYYEQKREQGKSFTPTTIAVAQKICNRIYAVLKRQTPYVVTKT
jgi:transposase